MEKRVIFAALLITVVLIFFNVFNAPTPQKPSKTPDSEEKIEQILEEAFFKPPNAEKIPVRTSLYTVLLSEQGGISSFRLNEYKTRDAGLPQLEQQLQKMLEQFRQKAKKEGIEANSHLLYSIKKLRYGIAHLRESVGNEGVELVSFSQLYNDSLPPFLEIRDESNKLVWAEKENYEFLETGQDRIQLIQQVPDFISLKKEFSFDPDSYLVKVKVILENIGSESIENHTFFITCGPDIGIDEGIRAFAQFEPVILVKNQIKKGEFGRGSQGKFVEKTEYGKINWVALQNKYFTEILIPNDAVRSAYLQKNEYEEHLAGLKTSIPVLEPGQISEFSFDLYLGPKKLEHLYEAGRETSKIVDYGLFGNLFQIVHILKFFHKLTNNYGVAIILLTVLINLILLPLSLKSFGSMKEMRKLQPEMERIRKEFKDDPQSMNKEVMELYRRHKVNPAGGCLPMLLQLPIFIGLFMTLRSVVELRGAPFVLWIKDLSLPDSIYTLPFSMPFLGADINVLPIVMTAVTFLQQKVSGAAGGTNQTMMLIFPILMLFIFYNFPSGLVLYFLCGNVINILGQLWINRPMLQKA